MKGAATLTPESFNTFGELLRYLRERADLSQRELALQVGYHYSYMSHIEKNERIPDAATLMARFVPALLLEDQPQWTERLLQLANREDESASPRRRKLRSASPSTVETALPELISHFNPIPVRLTPLLGREQERELVIRILSRPDVRLVTLIGPPGVGKTRLAIHVASRVGETFAHGVAFADLSMVESPTDVIPTLASALGVQEVPDEPLVTRVINFLKYKQILLVVDNFEHLLKAAPQLEQVLSHSPGVKALVTSRESLRISGEHEFRVNALLLPETSDAHLADNPAVQLFLQRAQAVKSDFSLTPENTPAIIELCHRLDGLPLAIELAAARANILTLQAMLAQFDRRFEWLAHTGRNASGSHRTLSSTVEWSYNLLTESEKALFRRLSVFSGGCDLPAAEAVCSDDALLAKTDIFQGLIRLTEKSLILAEESAGEPRWRLLETLRQFGHDRLVESAEWELCRARHLAYFANWMEVVVNTLDDGHVLEYYKYIEPELNNLRAALNWTLSEKAERVHGVRLAAAFCYLGLENSVLKESEEWFRKVLPLADRPEHRQWRATLLHRGACIIYLGHWHKGIHEAYQFAKEGEQIAREVNDPKILASSIYNQWEILFDLGKYEEARLLLEEGIELCRASGYQTQWNSLLSSLGIVLAKQGKMTEAMERAEEAYQIAERIGDLWGQGVALRTMALNLRAQKKYSESLETFARSLEFAKSKGDSIGSGIILANMAAVANALGDYPASGQYAHDALSIFQVIGSEYQHAFPLRLMAYAAIQAGDLTRARELNMKSLTLNYSMGLEHRIGVYGNLVAFAELATLEKQFERAAQLIALVEKRITEEKRVFQEPDALALQRVKSILQKKKVKMGDEVTLEQVIRELKN